MRKTEDDQDQAESDSTNQRLQQTLSVYEVAFDGYQGADRTLVYELYLSLAAISFLTVLIEQRIKGTFPTLMLLLFGLLAVTLVYFSSRTLEHVKNSASKTMREIERERFHADVPDWQLRIDREITYTAESGDELGWFRPLPSDSFLNRLVPTGWVGIQLFLVFVWLGYAAIKVL